VFQIEFTTSTNLPEFFLILYLFLSHEKQFSGLFFESGKSAMWGRVSVSKLLHAGCGGRSFLSRARASITRSERALSEAATPAVREQHRCPHHRTRTSTSAPPRFRVASRRRLPSAAEAAVRHHCPSAPHRHIPPSSVSRAPPPFPSRRALGLLLVG
jgi:hypothetical protein